MPEAGGTTTQSGIHYQNSIAALYLGRLIDPQSRIASENVIEVRVEAPEHVDDVVIKHSDGSSTYIQAKEALSINSKEWSKLWGHFAAQKEESADEKFKLVLAIGTISNDLSSLYEVCNRAKGKKNHEEWIDSLSNSLKAVADKIVGALPQRTVQYAFELISLVEVWIWPLKQIERDLMPIWIPESTSSASTLFDILRGKIGTKARIRGVFHASKLLDELNNENNIRVHDVASWGMDAYLQAIKTEMGTLTVPGTGLRGPIEELFFWMPLYNRDNDNGHYDFEDEDPQWRWNRQRDRIDLRNFPHGTTNRAVIDAGAGFGKTTMLHAIAYRLSSGVHVPVLISLDALAASNKTVLGYLNDKINSEYNVSIDWERMCESGRTVALFDGLDELSTIDRTNVLNIIIKFAARFPKVAFLITVRDSSALTIAIGLPILAFNRLDDFAIKQFAEAYALHGASLSAEVISNHLLKYPDLAHLLRIPLFLALVLVSISKDDNLPSSRSEIIEHYLSLLFSPERYKAIALPLTYLYDLREVAELLAWRGLEKDSINLAEIEARRFLREKGLKEQVDIYIDRLVQIGVLRRTAARLRFTFTIIQEYLAACWMITNSQNDIESRFANIKSRPWAQALQFALEMHPNGENIIANQLNDLDDAFNTKLRLIARCVVNGAKVSVEMRKLIAEQLVEAWPSESDSISESIGYILADGFIEQLPPNTVEYISSWAIHYGGAEIVNAKSSPLFTLEILKKYITKDLSLRPYLYRWQVSVDEIAEKALDMYIERVRNIRTTKKEMDSLASLIVSLSPSRLRPGRWSEIANEPSLPFIIRLAGFQLGPRPIPSSAWLIVDEVIRLSELDSINNSAYLAYKLYWYLQDAEIKFLQLLNDTTVPEKRIRSILEGLLRSEISSEAKRDILKRYIGKTDLSRNIRFIILFVLAICGDEGAEQEIIPMLIDQDFNDVAVWLHQSNRFSEKNIRDAANILSSRSMNGKQLLLLISSADFGLSYKTEATILNGVASSEPCIHALRNHMLNCLCSNLNDDESIDSLIIKIQTGDIKAREKVVTEVRRFVMSLEGVMQYEDDEKVSSILYNLERQNVSLPLDLLFLIIYKSCSNAGYSAVNWIVRIGDEKATIKLLESYNSRNKDFVREAIFAGLETLASRYGRRIIQKDDNLIIE